MNKKLSETKDRLQDEVNSKKVIVMNNKSERMKKPKLAQL